MAVTNGSQMMNMNHFKSYRVRVALNGLIYHSKLLQFNGKLGSFYKKLKKIKVANNLLIKYTTPGDDYTK